MVPNIGFVIRVLHPLANGIYFKQVREPMIKCWKRYVRMNKLLPHDCEENYDYVTLNFIIGNMICLQTCKCIQLIFTCCTTVRQNNTSVLSNNLKVCICI